MAGSACRKEAGRYAESATQDAPLPLPGDAGVPVGSFARRIGKVNKKTNKVNSKAQAATASSTAAAAAAAGTISGRCSGDGGDYWQPPDSHVMSVAPAAAAVVAAAPNHTGDTAVTEETCGKADGEEKAHEAASTSSVSGFREGGEGGEGGQEETMVLQAKLAGEGWGGGGVAGEGNGGARGESNGDGDDGVGGSADGSREQGQAATNAAHAVEAAAPAEAKDETTVATEVEMGADVAVGDADVDAAGKVEEGE